MLLQVGSVVVKFGVRKSDSGGYEMSDPLTVLCPSGDTVCYANDALRKFVLSQDGKLVGMIVRLEKESTVKFGI